MKNILNNKGYKSSLLHGLRGWWRMDEGSGLYAYDSSGHCNHGSNVNMDNSNWESGADRKIGNALYFDGIDERVNCGTDTSLQVGLEDFSISGWIKVDANISQWAEGIIGKRQDNNYKWGVNIKGALTGADMGKVNPRLGKGGAAGCWMLDSTTLVNDNIWHHFAVTVDRDGYMKVYVDGIYENQVDISSTSGVSQDNTGILILGHLDNQKFNGIMDDIRVYNRVLNDDEIRCLARIGN